MYAMWIFNWKGSKYYYVLGKCDFHKLFIDGLEKADSEKLLKKFKNIFHCDRLVLCTYKKVSSWLEFGHYFLHNSPFEQWYSTTNAIDTVEIHSGKSYSQRIWRHLLQFALNLLCGMHLHLWEGQVLKSII